MRFMESNYSVQNKPILKFILKNIEKKIINKTSSVVTVSDYLSKKISKYYNVEIYIVPNGYDFTNINSLKISQIMIF